MMEKTDVSPIGPDHQLSPPPHKGHRGVRLLVWLLILVVFGLAFYWVLHHNSAPKPAGGGGRRGAFAGPVTLTTAPVQQRTLGVYLNAIGTVTPVYTAAITAQASGVVTAVHYREGQIVRKGDSLIDIDPRPYQATLLQAQGLLERDTSLLAQARMDLDRYRLAWSKNAIPRQTLEDQEKLVLQNEGTVKNDQGTVQYDQVQLDYCHITSPITGRVGLRLLDPGNVVQANSTTPLVIVTQVQPITVIFTVAQDSLPQVQQQMRHGHTLAVDAYDRSQSIKLASGKLLTLGNQIDTTTGTLKLRAMFDNKSGALFPNQFVNTRLLVNQIPNATVVPTEAIQHNGPTAFVYAIENGVAHVKNVKTGVNDEGFTQVDGLNPGEVVATSSFEKLQDKSKVVLPGQAPQHTGKSHKP